MNETELIKTIIKAAHMRGISQGELASLVGIRQETLSRAKKNPTLSLKICQEMARVVGLRLQLMPDSPVVEQMKSGTLFPTSR
jgi:DNA-binding XRE family transcriptional regulator